MPATSPWRAQSAGVTTRRTSMSPARPGSSRSATVETSWSAYAPAVASQSVAPVARLGAGARTHSRSRPGGARAGSEAVGRVMSREGSVIGWPSSMICRNVSCQAPPNEIV